MSKVVPISGVSTAQQVEALGRLGQSLADALNIAKSAGVPQSLIVAILHGHAQQETAEMMADPF